MTRYRTVLTEEGASGEAIRRDQVEDADESAALAGRLSGDPVMSRSSLPGLNRILKPGGICTSSVGRFGLRPMPHFLGFTRNTPKPRSSMRSPRVSAWRSTSMIVSTAYVAFWRPTPAASATALTMSSLITWGRVYASSGISRKFAP